MKKSFLFVLIVCFALLFLSCTDKKEEPATPEETIRVQRREIVLPTEKEIGKTLSAIRDDFDKTEEDDYDEERPLSHAQNYIVLSDEGCLAKDADGNDLSSSYVSFSGNIVSIKHIGTYVLTGEMTNGRVIVEGDDSIQIILNGVNIHCEGAPAFETYGKGKRTLTLAKGKENFLSDGKEERGLSALAALRARGTLLINGEGSLAVEGEYDGIVAAQLKIKDARLSVKAKKRAVSSDGYVYVRGATIEAEGEDLIYATNEMAFFESNVTAVGQEVFGRDIWMEDTVFELSGKGDGLIAGRYFSAQQCLFKLSVGGDGIVARGESDMDPDGIVRLSSCTTVISDGDDGIKAKYLMISSGSFLCYGMGTQLSVSDGIESFSAIQEVLLPSSVAKGKKVVVGEMETVFDREWRTFVYLGKQGDGCLYIDEEKYAVLW